MIILKSNKVENKNMKNIKKLFTKVRLIPVDPLDDGLHEMILQEKRETGAFRLDNDPSDIVSFWNSVETETKDGHMAEFSSE